MKLGKIDEHFETFILERSIKCESQREKKEKIYRMVRKKESIMFMSILWLTWPCLAIKGLR